MASTENDILRNIIDTLRAGGEFASVSLGEPRAAEKGSVAVVFMDSSERVDAGVSRLCPDIRMRMKIRILIRIHSASTDEGIERITTLAGITADTLLEDETRGGICSTDIIGRGTEIIKQELSEKSGYSQEITISLHCHYMIVGAEESYFMATLDGLALFSSGPGELFCESWPRETIRRGFSGLGGEIMLDLGRRSRRIKQRGMLRANTAELLRNQIIAVESMADGETHTLAENGVTYSNVIMEKFEQLSEIRNPNVCSCEYEIIYRQLP